MQRGPTGVWVPQSWQGRDFEAFVPHVLPPRPDIQWDPSLIQLFSRASAGVARLDGAARLLPDLHLFLYSYVRKEAVLSSQIEGTQSSLSDLLMHENEMIPGVPFDDVVEVSNYVAALDEGIARVRQGENISIDLLLDLHRILLAEGRGAARDPGCVRGGQNWIGGATPDRAIFVPPPVAEVRPSLETLLAYVRESADAPLLKAALAHVQFETIHPFRDGNGRIGRLLITVMLCSEKIISEPMVYLSHYFREHREDYYQKLQVVRETGDWEDWLRFFWTGLAEVTESAFEMTGQIQELFEKDSGVIRAEGGRRAHGMLELFRALQKTPVLTIAKASEHLAGTVSKPTLYAAANRLVELGIVSQGISSQGVQYYLYDRYVDILRK